ncbi:GDSL-type esterase/lipase family protein [Clostridium sp. DSM 100503]|uniref:GDSL-type esterase/lipase family protein n=1 Tax=Clostridium sp. DSM 100503 TaxID=2963282 RepID=UPI00214A739C|nr:GDSL-type esterase/lipase family protein [Clostridium sp. DSM 100503]MCR1953018.1 GDSL-type esterase/lipase family protein [Clostridium sp. DSM 100503]
MQKNSFVFIGDSLTYGYGVNKNNNWVESLNPFIPLDIINKGINGNTTTDMLNRFTEDVISYSPKKIFIMGGTNDFLSNRSLDSVLDNLELMLKEALTITKDVIIGIPPIIIKEDAYRLFMQSSTYDYCEKQLQLLGKSIIELCNKYTVTYVNFYSLTFKFSSNNIFIDGIHLNNNGQNLLLNEFKQLLKNMDSTL